MDAFSVVLIVTCLIFIIVYFYRQWKNYKEEKDNATWPKKYNDCPDYWMNDGKHVCRNVLNLGKCGKNGSNSNIMDFKIGVGGILSSTNETELRDKMNTKDALIKKCRWSKKCDVSWEGVNNLCT